MQRPQKSSAREKRTALIAWALYDLANSAHAAIIQTFVFAAYFVSHVAANKAEGVALWGLALGISGLFVAFGGPVFGAIADQGGGRKKGLASFTAICIGSIALMWFVKPSSAYTGLALVLTGIAAASSDFAYIFYNAMLPELASPGQVGRWSGWGWAAGYLGGMVSLILCLFAFVNGPSTWLPLDRSTAQEVRVSFLFVAIWFIIFSFPIFLLTPPDEIQKKKTMMALAEDAFLQLKQSFRHIHTYRNIFRFLVARMIFTDALVTLFAFGGVYAAAQFNMEERAILVFGIALNISAGIGAVLFAFYDDLYGGKTMILASLIGLIATGTMAVLARSSPVFWIWGIALGLFVGPAQASSRSYMARMAPAELRNQMFGFFALSAKVTAFLGPICVSWLTYLTGSLRAGMSTIIFFLLVGFLLMLTVKSDKMNGVD